MRMLNPKELPRTKAKPVASYDDIADDAERMLKMVEAPFKGQYEYAYALAHSQVAYDHKAFFTVHGDLVKRPEGDAGKGWEQTFPHRVILNPEILEKPAHISQRFKELNGTKVAAVKNTGQMPEGCLSFPFRKARNVLRYHRIKVRFQTPDGLFGGFKTHTLWLEGLAAHIFQHETDHLKGTNIFHG